MTACTAVPREYHCTEHAQCAENLTEGRCELTGSCSVVDPSCSSARRYVSDLAGARSGICVPGELPKWIRTVGGAGTDRPTAVIVDPAGNPIVSGGFEADLRGDIEATSAGQVDVLLVGLGQSAGDVTWTAHGRGAQLDYPAAMAWTGTTTLAIAGYTAGALQFGSATIQPSAPGRNAFHAVFRVDPEPILEQSVITGGTAAEQLSTVAGSIVAGTFTGGSLAVGGTTLATTSFGEDGWVARIAANGAIAWSHVWAGTAPADRVTVSAIGSGATSSLVVGGFSGSVTLPGAAAATTSRGAGDGFAFSVTPAGAIGASFVVSGPGNDLLHDVAFDASGQAWLAGYVEGAVQLGTTPTQPIGTRDAVVYRSSGGVRWRAGAADRTTEAIAIAFDAAGQAIVVGSFQDSVDLGGGVTLTGRGGRDVFVCELSPDDGRVAWATVLGGPDDDDPVGVAVLASGDLAVVGSFSATADFGGVERTSAGLTDWFIVTLPDR